MSSRKRHWHDDDVDGEPELQSASSSLRQTHQKRSRIALAAERGGSVVSDEDDDFDRIEHGQEVLHHRWVGQSSDDNSVDESEDEDRDYERATQFVQKSMRQHKENIASDQGVIEEVTCRNFMCHALLRIKLSPLINFIVGNNGSGKSAVLTALVLCLGGRAADTNRGNTLKSLIKEGEESTVLQVKIKNQGEGAYRPDLFGRSIVVERHFSRSGASGFKIKNASERIISTKKSELDDILDYYGLQLDNPINVLTQDMARQFLANSTPVDKYKFFIRGTQLETLDADYRMFEEHLDNMEMKLRARQDDIKVLKDKAEAAKQKKKRADQTQVLQRKIKESQDMFVWAQVENEENKLQEFNDKLAEVTGLVAEAEDDAMRKSSAYEGHNQSFEGAERNFNEIKLRLEPMQDSFNSEKQNFDAKKQELIVKKNDERHLKDSISNTKRRCDQQKIDIAQEEAKLAGNGGEEQNARSSRLQELEQEAQEAIARYNEHDAAMQQIQENATNALRDLRNGAPELKSARDELQLAESRVSRLQQDRGHPFAAYRPNMEKLVRSINQESRWRSKPVGPIGMHVKLLKPEWSSQLETTFGNALDCFVVTCLDDQDLLSKMMKRVQCETGIYIGDPTTLRHINEPEDTTIDTALRVLEIDSHLVRNQLIINQAIDQLVLISDRNEAHRYMRSRPRYVRATMCISESNRRAGVRFELTRTGAEKSGPIRPWERGVRMKTSVEDQMRMATSAVEQAKLQVHQKEAEERGKRSATEKANQAVTRYRREKERLKTAMQRAEDAVERQQEEIEAHQPQDGRLQELQQQLKEAESDIELSKRQFQDLINEIDTINNLQRETKQRMEEADKQIGIFKVQLEKAQKRHTIAANRREESLREKNKALNEIERLKVELTRLEGLKAEQAQTLQEFTGEADKYCKRVTVEAGATPESLTQKIAKFQSDLERQEREIGGTREQLVQAYRDAVLEHQKRHLELAELNKTCLLLKRTLATRQDRWEKFRRFITARSRSMFQYLLSERNFRGRVIIDHKEKTLDLNVEPDLSKISDAGRQAKTLSGGEKSFSTICLLLSIWEAMGSPIRCLDEFDVFMDNVNRATSMTMMIGAARRAVGRQFILITPQSMANVDIGDDVSIHKMRDPERGQTILPF